MTQTEHEFTAHVELDVSLRYLLYLPDDARERPDRPLIVFLHGSGERGDDLSLVLKQGLPRLLEEGLELPAAVLSPQLPAGQLWTRQLPALRALIEHIVNEHNLDRERIVVTGLSLGGAGAYELASAHPETFAAVAPICGPWTWMFVTDQSARLPTWVFHGDADEVVPVGESLRLVEELRQRGAEPRLSVYPGVGHNSWDKAYGDPELLEWLVQGRR